MRTPQVFGIGAALLLVVGGYVAHRALRAPLADSPNPMAMGAAFAVPDGDAGAPRSAPVNCGQMAGASCVEYRSERYHFSFFHSGKDKVREYDEGGGATTLTFESSDVARSFQIFIVPYAEESVTEERFQRDSPSGVRKDLTNVSVAGAVGAAFYGRDARLGNTYEAWFVRGGYLYEVTALASRAAELAERLQTWQFF